MLLCFVDFHRLQLLISDFLLLNVLALLGILSYQYWVWFLDFQGLLNALFFVLGYLSMFRYSVMIVYVHTFYFIFLYFFVFFCLFD